MKTEEKKAQDFYKETIILLNNSGIPYMLGGGFALYFHTGIYRDTKDLDVFCKPGDYPKIMKYFADLHYKTELTDARWLAKIFNENHFIDIIFNTVNNICTVDDSWLEYATKGNLFDAPTQFLSVEELIWCKIYVQNRERFDGADVNHLILRNGKNLNWNRLLNRFDQNWHLLLAQLVTFQFVYPADFHEIIPKEIFVELMNRANQQYELPPPQAKVCRGPIIDQTQYAVDIKEWNYKVTTIKTT